MCAYHLGGWQWVNGRFSEIVERGWGLGALEVGGTKKNKKQKTKNKNRDIAIRLLDNLAFK